MLNTFDFLVIAAYFAALALFGVFVRRVRGLADFALARRALPTSMVFASLASTYIGPGFAVGMTGRGYTTGLLFGLAACAFVLQTVLVGMFVAPRISRFTSCHTVGDIIGTTFGRTAHVLAGVVSVGMCLGFAAVMARAGAGVIAGALHWPLFAGVLLVTGIGVTYTLTGGLRSVVATEAFQFSLFAIAVPLICLSVLVARGPELTRFGNVASELTSKAIASTPTITIVGIVVSFLLGETLIPPYTVRALASASSAISRRGFIYAGAFGVFWLAVVTAIGIQATYALGAPITTPDDAFMAMTGTFLPHGMIGLVVVALAAIVMSSQESVLNAGAVSVVRDLVQPFSPRDDAGAVMIGRIVTLVLGAIAGVAALYAPSIIDGLLILYSVWAPTILVPLLWAVFRRPGSSLAGCLAILLGGAASLLWRFWLNEPGSVPSILVGLIGSGAGLSLGLLLQRPASRKEEP